MTFGGLKCKNKRSTRVCSTRILLFLGDAKLKLHVPRGYMIPQCVPKRLQTSEFMDEKFEIMIPPKKTKNRKNIEKLGSFSVWKLSNFLFE